MHKNLPSILILTALFLVASCNTKEPNKFIKGTIEGLGNNPIILMDAKNYPLDTVLAENDSFVFEHEQDLNDPKMQGVFLPQLSNKKGGRRINKAFFFIDGNAIGLTAKIVGENLQEVQITGSPATKAFDEFNANFPASIALEKYTQPYTEAFNQYNTVEKSEENLAKLRYYGGIVDSLFQLRRENIVDAISTNNESLPLSYIVYQNFKNESPDFLQDVIDRFSPSMKNSYYISLLAEQVSLKQKVSIGVMAPDVALFDETDEVRHLASYFGDNYVLIDFWASWCGPCKREFPHLKEAHEEFKDKVKIVSVSIDANKEAWQKALVKEQLPYVTLWDQKAETQKLYQFQGIPHIVLVAPNGKIVMKNEGLRGKELEKTLEALSL